MNVERIAFVARLVKLGTSGATECFLDTDQPVERSWSERWMGCSRHGSCSATAYEYRWNKEDEEIAIMPTIVAVLDDAGGGNVGSADRRQTSRPTKVVRQGQGH